jgi:hypothetical protein
VSERENCDVVRPGFAKHLRLDSPVLCGLRFNSDRVAKYSRGVPAAGVHLIPVGSKGSGVLFIIHSLFV